jgi:hypothetical protein
VGGNAQYRVFFRSMLKYTGTDGLRWVADSLGHTCMHVYNHNACIRPLLWQFHCIRSQRRLGLPPATRGCTHKGDCNATNAVFGMPEGKERLCKAHKEVGMNKVVDPLCPTCELFRAPDKGVDCWTCRNQGEKTTRMETHIMR